MLPPNIPAESIDPNLSLLNQTGDKTNVDNLSDYDTCKQRLESLYKEFEHNVIERVNADRTLREVDINLKEERAAKRLKEDDIMIPVRVIDTNIKRETPPYVGYLRQSKRITTFKATSNPNFVPDQLEQEFAAGMTYPKWERPWMKLIDGSKTHGYDWIEVVYDETKPLKVGLEHIGKDRLVFATDSEDLQANELISRIFKLSPRSLKRMVSKWGFNEEQVKKLTDKTQSRDNKEHKITIHRVYFKVEDVVHVGWLSLQGECSDWLLAPRKLFIGRRQKVQVNAKISLVNTLAIKLGLMQPQTSFEWQDSDEEEYPIFGLPLSETEQANILDVKGRVFLDKHKQEAATANISGFLSALNRSAGIYGSIDGPTENRGRAESIKIESGKIISERVNLWSPPAPNPSMLAVAQYLAVMNSEESGQVTYAANNRQDTEKTATEVKSARQDQTLLNTVGLTLFSTCVRETYTFVFEIVRSQALQGKIPLLVQQEVSEGVYQNDEISLKQKFDIRAAGDTDVLERQDLISRYKEFWPIVQNTPLAMIFLEKMLRLSFPNDGDSYSKVIEQGDTMQLLMSAGQIIQGLLSDNPTIVNNISPQEQSVLTDFMNKITQLLSTQQQIQKGQNTNTLTSGGMENMMTKGAEGGMANAG